MQWVSEPQWRTSNLSIYVPAPIRRLLGVPQKSGLRDQSLSRFGESKGNRGKPGERERIFANRRQASPRQQL